MKLSSPDIETFLPPRLQAGLQAMPRAWDTSVGRTRGSKPLAVTVQRAGGPVHGKLDYPRLLINVYAPDDGSANDLANDVITVLGDLRGTNPLVRIEASGPSPIMNDREKQRFISADALVIRTHLH